MAAKKRSTKARNDAPTLDEMRQWREWAEKADYRLTSAIAILHLIDPAAPSRVVGATLQDAISGVDVLLAEAAEAADQRTGWLWL